VNAITTSEATALPVNTSSTALVLSNDAMDRAFRMAELMAAGRATVPKHLQGNVADCMAVTLQALQWNMSPFAVAQKTHLVNGTLGYEAQLVIAVLQSTGSITGEFSYEYEGTGEGLKCRVGATPRGKTAVTWGEWLTLGSVTTRNSPLWKTNPKQQLGYLQVKNWARLYKPGAILGVYTPDELQEPQEIHMGDAVVVEPERATLSAWPDDKWAKQLPSILKGIQGGKTVADALAWLGAKGIVTAEQEKELRNKAQELTQPAATPASAPQEGAPVVDPAKLEADIKACTDLDTLYGLGNQIETIADPSQQATLTDIFDARVAELEQA